jgi:hypothetical protein
MMKFSCNEIFYRAIGFLFFPYDLKRHGATDGLCWGEQPQGGEDTNRRIRIAATDFGKR